MDKETVYYFVGIKGSGMSSLALILHDKGFEVEGSDIEQYTFTQKGLAAAGIKMLPFSADNIHEGLTVIAGNSFTDDHTEIKKARKRVPKRNWETGEINKNFIYFYGI